MRIKYVKYEYSETILILMEIKFKAHNISNTQNWLCNVDIECYSKHHQNPFKIF